MSSEDENYNSDEEVNKKSHSKLIQDIIQLDKKQYVKKPTRTEPTLQVSEFNLVKSNATKITLNDLTKSLQKEKNHVDINKKISKLKVQTLAKPLEKPQRERIKRSIGFKEVKLDLGKWDPIVMKNRVTVQQHFPLDHDGKIEIKNDKKDNGFKLSIKTDLDKELEAIEAEYKPPEKEEVIEAFPLTLKEVMEKRREMARLRAHQSYQEAKAHRQNKIKSKKFHRIKRKEKIKNQLKEFEKLQKTDPEEALRKLEELDKTRAEERMSLRHRSTGQWAKNKQIRAKYDKESRQILAEQLTLSRQLTQKTKRPNESSSESSDDEAAVDTSEPFDPSNPWIKPIKTEKEVDEFLSGYRKYWDEQNKKNNDNQMESNLENEGNLESNDSSENNESQESSELKNQVSLKINRKVSKENGNSDSGIEEDKIVTRGSKRKVDKTPDVTTKKKIKKSSKKHLDENEILKSLNLSELLGSKLKKQNNKLMKQNKKMDTIKCTTEWEIETLTPQENEEQIQEMFEELETVTANKLKTKLNSFKREINKPTRELKIKEKPKQKNKERTIKKKLKTKNYLELPREKYRPEIDEELISSLDNDKPKLKRYFPKEENLNAKPDVATNIDPNQFLNAQPTELDTLLPDNIIFGDDNEDQEVEKTQKELISEAFEGDDVVAEFQKEKQDVVNKDKPEDVNLTLPGWGTWGGKDIQPSKRKTKRFIRKFPKKMPRRDENKGNLILYENKNENLKKHLVSDVPFPFKTVKDFESSIRAPIGDTFIPQTAFRRLIKPSVTTKKGEVIKPMDEDVLLKYKLTKNGMVVKR